MTDVRHILNLHNPPAAAAATTATATTTATFDYRINFLEITPGKAGSPKVFRRTFVDCRHDDLLVTKPKVGYQSIDGSNTNIQQQQQQQQLQLLQLQQKLLQQLHLLLLLITYNNNNDKNNSNNNNSNNKIYTKNVFFTLKLSSN